MLHTETVDPHTLELLRGIQRLPFFKDTRLVGCTALSLEYGHLMSIDLDFFGTFIRDVQVVQSALDGFEQVVAHYNTPSIYAFSVNGLKVDIVSYKYPWLDDPLCYDGVKMASPRDIGAIKLSAIAGRGSKKDFVDVYYLLQQFSLAELISFYEEKYSDGNTFLVLKSLTYFDDADATEVDMLDSSVSWSEMKDHIMAEHLHFIR